MKGLKADLLTISKTMETLTKKLDIITKKMEKLEQEKTKKKSPVATPKTKPSQKASPKETKPSQKASPKETKPSQKVPPKETTPPQTPEPTAAIDTVLDMICQSKDGISIDELRKKTNFKSKKIHGILYKLKKREKIKNPKKGVYAKA